MTLYEKIATTIPLAKQYMLGHDGTRKEYKTNIFIKDEHVFALLEYGKDLSLGIPYNGNPFFSKENGNLDDNGINKYWYLLYTKGVIKPLIIRGNSIGYTFWQMAYASNQELKIEFIQHAIDKMKEFKGDESNRLINIKPNIIVVNRNTIIHQEVDYFLNDKDIEILRMPERFN